MRISYSTLNRICESKAATDANVRDTLRQDERPLLSHGRALTDEALLAKLGEFGFTIERSAFAARAEEFLSAQGLAEDFLAQVGDDRWGQQEDWIWIALTCLWERWLPERPSLEMIDDWMQAGYKALEELDDAAACRHWLPAWQSIRRIMMGEHGLRTIDEFDDLFGGTQSVFNWVQDFSTGLYNAGLQDPSFWSERVRFLDALVNKVELPESIRPNLTSDLAESWFLTGAKHQCEGLYRSLLAKEPTWGFGWIGWADCHSFLAPEGVRDLERAEAILKEGLAVPKVEDREHLLERLADVYQETERQAEARTLRQEAEWLRNPPPLPTRRALNALVAHGRAGGPRTGLDAGHVGRNDPCPCGSGKKFKKCCLKARSG